MIDYTKRGIIVIGSARSGSHMTCDMLYNESTVENKIKIGEITDVDVKSTVDKYHDKFIYGSIVQYQIKNILAKNIEMLKDFNIVNIRRSNKIDQYISWCVFRAQGRSSIIKHSPNWDDYKNFLPWASTKNDLELFLMEQHLDFAFLYDDILYYEEITQTGMKTQFKKNSYPIPYQDIVTDYDLVVNFLKDYSYNGR